MFRTSMVVVGLVFCSIGCGCALSQERICPPTRQAAPRKVAEIPASAASLLFDRRPGRYNASEFAFRSDWPSTVSFYSVGELVYSNQRLIDVQGPGRGGFTYQQSDTERVTIGYR